MKQSRTQHYEFGLFRLDARERLLQRDGATISLTPKAFDLLLVLVEQHGRLVEKEELFRAVWPDTIVEESNLSSNIALIRKALGDGVNGERYIETVPKRGYRFVAEVREGSATEDSSRFELPLLPVNQPPSAGAVATSKRANRYWWGAGTILVGLLSSIAIWWLTFIHTPTLPPMKLTPFTSLPGEKMQPSFSPDGNQISFAWRGENGGPNHVYVKQVGNETVRKLTGDPKTESSEYSPVWSPEGRSIAFIKRTKEGCGVWMIPSLGGVERRITEPSLFFYAGFMDWSRDGEWIVIEGNKPDNKTYYLYLLTIKTGEIRQLTAPPAGTYGDKAPKFSPDGKTIVFQRSVAYGASDIFSIPFAGGNPKQLTFDIASALCPVWTIDGQEILFVNSATGGLWRIPATGGKPIQVEKAPQRLDDIAISKQGDRLALVEVFDNTDIWQMELGTRTGTSPKQLIYSTRNDDCPQISPDGKKIAFGSSRSGNEQIWICDRDGKNAVQLTFAGRNSSPRWAPDSSQIVYNSVDNNADIYAIDIEGGQPRRLTIEPSEDIAPSWSRDGKWVYFASGRSGSLQIWRLPATGGQAVQVTKQGGYDSIESADGKYLYYLKGRRMPGLWRVPTSGGEETLVLDHHQAGIWRYWDVTQQGIYFATSEQLDHPLIEFYDFTRSKITLVGSLNKMLHVTLPGLTASPDGHWLLWTQRDKASNDIILLENFR